MFEIIVPLKYIVLDPEKPIDLTVLSPHDSINLIKKSYGFLSPAINISIENDTAVIRLDEPRAEKIAEALQHFQKGSKAAQKGEYQKAIKHYAKVLETIPHHLDARRNLAMAHLEQGKIEPAKKLLKECLKLDPTNVWSLALLGNIATRHDRNPDVAAFYFETGLAISPNDNILLNNFAALQMERGRMAEAQSLFERALAANPSYPNTYCGLALLHKVTRAPEKALGLLERLFDQPRSADIRSGSVYQNARELYAELCADLASRDSGTLLESILARKEELEAATGHPISIEEDASLEYVSATAQMAWKHGRDEHRVRYRLRSPAVTPHLVAHELEHIVLEHEARMLGRNRVFISTAATRERAVLSIRDHLAKLQKQGYSESNISEVMLKLVHGLNNQVFNCPLDMVVEYNLFRKHPALRRSQFISLCQMHDESLKTYINQEIKRITPPLIFRASTTLNCAYALFIDHLFGGRTDCAAAYRSFDNLPTARSFLALWKKRMESFHPGDEYELVDEYARQLKLRAWYDWRPDTGRLNASAADNDLDAPSAPLTSDKPEAYTFCLDALCRFEGKDRDHIFTVVSEIGFLGMGGIDHETPGKMYTLKAYPSETFSGLHLLCLMYVGFKIIEPATNTGLDFSEAYKMALEAHRAMVH